MSFKAETGFPVNFPLFKGLNSFSLHAFWLVDHLNFEPQLCFEVVQLQSADCNLLCSSINVPNGRTVNVKDGLRSYLFRNKKVSGGFIKQK